VSSQGNSGTHTVRAVDRAFSILSAVTIEGATLTELAQHSGLPLPTVLRLLETAQASGFIERTANSRYIPGPALLRIAYKFDPEGMVRSSIRDAIERLRDKTDETVAFDVQEGAERYCVDSLESRQSVRRSRSRLETYRPFYVGAAGKVLIAFGDSERLLRMVPQQHSLGSGEIRGVAELTEQCEKVRRDGYAFAPMEVDREAWGMAAPVFVEELLYGVLVVSAPMTRSEDIHVQRCIEECCEAAEQLTRRLSVIFGGRGQPIRNLRAPSPSAMP
jgi:DNA-binding IclR family transcriptional regulator